MFLFSLYLMKIIYNKPSIEIEKLYSNSNINIYDSNNNLLDTNCNYKTYVSFKNISPHLINAVLATEDKNYFSHNGISYGRILKACYNNILSKRYKEGASTITQQLIKNTLLTSDKTMNRKLTEIVLALDLEKQYTKEQILELYLNNILLGDNVYGVYDASLFYFNKHVKDLTIDEAATIAGLIQLPNYYSPYHNLLVSTERRNLVLDLMKNEKYIGETQCEILKKINLEEKLNRCYIYNKEEYYNSYLDYISNESFPNNSKVKLYMNKEIQKELYDISKDKYNIIKDPNIKIALVAIDNKTGGLLGIVGNTNSNKKVINYATVKRQMASTMKPIMDYAPAFEYLNYSPGTLISDVPYTYKDGTPLKNWDYQFKGTITLRKALRESRNIPALKLYQMINSDKRVEFINRLGLNPVSELYEAEALGAGQNGYSLLEICNAYSAFANMGKFIKCEAIKSVDGVISYKNKETKYQAMKESTAFFINNILHDVFKGTSFDLPNTYMMAKTGQTNFDEKTRNKYNIPINATKDSLVIAYTKSITFGVWVGYDIVKQNAYLDNISVQIPRSIMKIFMHKFGGKNEYYEIPKSVSISKIEITDNELYLSNNGLYEYFLIGYAPIEYYKKKYYTEI